MGCKDAGSVDRRIPLFDEWASRRSYRDLFYPPLAYKKPPSICDSILVIETLTPYSDPIA